MMDKQNMNGVCRERPTALTDCPFPFPFPLPPSASSKQIDHPHDSNCCKTFPTVEYAYTAIPTYPSGQIGFMLLSNTAEGALRACACQQA
jgi:hypothetical protein